MLTVRFTRPWCLRWVPAFGLCEITRPARTLLEKACLILPAEQECVLRARFATRRVLPFTLGTTQFFSVNFAVAVRGPVTLSLHLDLPWHAPDQPAKLEPRPGFAFSVTEVRNAYLCEQVLGQRMPLGELVILPEPLPLLWTFRVCNGGLVYVNEAVADGAPVASLSTV